MIELLLFLLKLFLKVSSIFVALITLYYILGLSVFIYDAFDYLGKDAVRFGIWLFIVFIIIAIPLNLALFYIIW